MEGGGVGDNCEEALNTLEDVVECIIFRRRVGFYVYDDQEVVSYDSVVFNNLLKGEEETNIELIHFCLVFCFLT